MAARRTAAVLVHRWVHAVGATAAPTLGPYAAPVSTPVRRYRHDLSIHPTGFAFSAAAQSCACPRCMNVTALATVFAPQTMNTVKPAERLVNPCPQYIAAMLACQQPRPAHRRHCRNRSQLRCSAARHQRPALPAGARQMRHCISLDAGAERERCAAMCLPPVSAWLPCGCAANSRRGPLMTHALDCCCRRRRCRLQWRRVM